MPTLKHRLATLFSLLMITCLVALPLLTSQPTSAQSTDYIEKTFSWDYDGHHWNWNLSIPTTLYEAYKSIPLVTRTHNGPSGYGYLTTTEDPYIQMLANKLNQTTTELSYSPYDQVSFALAFVQSLPYTSDNVTEGYNEYPRFPIETLVDEGGDCEDTSILFASITSIMGYGTVYLSPPNHYAVGILGTNIAGTSWEYPEGSNRTYYYCETTGDNFKIGQLPFEFIGQSAFIYPIDENTQYIPEIIVTTAEPTPTRSAIIGSASPTPLPNNDGDPTTQTPMPLSFNLVEKNPGVSIVIILAIAGSFALAIWSVRRPNVIHKAKYDSEPSPEDTTLTDGGDKKFCTSCGSQNRENASFCDKCGTQISD